MQLFGTALLIAKDAYYLPMFMSMCMAAGFGIHGLLGAARTWTVHLAAAIALLMPAVAFAGNFGINNRRSFFVAEDYAGDITATIAPGGMLLTGDWQVASPMLYLQEIVHQRRDVICIDVQLLRRSWYFLLLESKYPSLMLQARSSVQAFLEDLHRWEGDPQLYERDSSLNRRITARFHAMIEGLVRAHLLVAPVYATQDVVMTLQGEGQPLSDFLRAAFQIVPQGLAFQLFADREVHRPALAPLRTRGLWDAPTAVREDEVVRQKILPGGES